MPQSHYLLTAAETARALVIFSSAVFTLAVGLSPAADEPPDHERIQTLIQQLGDSNWTARQKATDELRKIGLPARAALAQALQSSDVEIVVRARAILEELSWTTAEDTREVSLLLQTYGKLDGPDRRSVVVRLAGLGIQQSLPALLRIVQYDGDEEISFLAATAIEITADNATATRVLEAHPKLARPALLRLLSWAQSETARPEALATLETAVDLEKKRLAAPESQGGTRRFLVEMTGELARRYEKSARRETDRKKLLQTLEEMAPESPDQLVEFLDWLLEAGLPRQVIAVLEKTNKETRQDIRLQYQCAAAFALLGDTVRAEAAAMKAIDHHGDDASKHREAAEFLARCSMETWAKREFQKVLSLQSATDEDKLRAAAKLMALAYGQLDLKVATEYLEKAIALAEKNRWILEIGGNNSLDDLKTFGAMLNAVAEFEQTGKRDGLKELLDEVAAKFSEPLLTTIPYYNLLMAENKPAQAVQHVETARAAMLKQIRADPLDADKYNSLAWVLARTNQRLEEAKRLALTALRLKPTNKHYMDTLAEVFFRLGQVDQAIELEKRALRLNPDDPWLTRQLRRFQTEKPSPYADENRGEVNRQSEGVSSD